MNNPLAHVSRFSLTYEEWLEDCVANPDSYGMTKQEAIVMQQSNLQQKESTMTSQRLMVLSEDHNCATQGLYTDLSGNETYYDNSVPSWYSGNSAGLAKQVDMYAHDSLLTPANDGSYHGSGMMAAQTTAGQVLQNNGGTGTWAKLTLDNAGLVGSNTISVAPQVHGYIQTYDTQGREVVRIEQDGTVKIGQGVTVDEASQEFYNQLLVCGSGQAEEVRRLRAENAEIRRTVKDLNYELAKAHALTASAMVGSGQTEEMQRLRSDSAELKNEIAAADKFINHLLDQLSTEHVELEHTVDPLTAYERAMKGV